MVTKSKKQSATEKKRKVKVGGLKLNKETVKDLTGGEKKGIMGGGKKTETVVGCQYSKCTKVNCISQLYPGGPCGFESKLLDCI